ncbi:Bromodomain-containing protein [Halteromyces radiatus]|uniref:Bromodomain-containing protein n=1 Tax=Halteromyces radiatus TaxID=101107 RepID=UPI0022200856|nr:Bromodomain-containing protein [Halteromyces radiatus]KAI8098960.1 Bromodomain-containing protein [Halteromyces radiatus]
MASTPAEQQQQQQQHELNFPSEQPTIGTPKPVDDDNDDLHTTKKQKLDHLASATLSPLSTSSLSPSSQQQQLQQQESTQSIEPITTMESSPTAAALATNTPLAFNDTPTDSQKDASQTTSTAATYGSPVDTATHSPETLEIISNEGSSPPPSAFANGTGINLNQSKPRKQKSSRGSSPSPYSFASSSNSNMTRDQIKYCGAIMRNLKKHRDATPFIHPVDYVKLKIPDYPKIIKHPIDLTTIDRKLQHGEYNDVNEFVADIRLLFNNCYKFNGPEAMVSMLCQNVESAFEKSLRQMPPSKDSPSANVSPDVKEGSVQHQQHSPLHGTSSFRRISEDSRPKREIHPPPSKDYPETMTKQRRRRSNGAHTGAAGTSGGRRRKMDAQLKFCGQAIRELKKNKYRDINYPFLHPVDAVALNIPDYHTIITHPMDISTIERQLNEGEYDSPESFESDVRLMFNNCYRYNPPALPVHKMAKDLEKVFDEKWKHLPEPEPSPPPPSPPRPTQSSVITRKADSYSTEEEEEEENVSDDSEDDRDDRIAELERHIANISQQIASIKSTKKKSDRKSTAGVKRKSKQSTTSAHRKTSKEKAPPKPRRRAPKQQRKPSLGSELPEFTFEQKKELSESINNLTGERLNTVVNIIQSSMPNLDGGQEEIVLDIDALDRKTLHRLHEFVTGKSLIRRPTSAHAKHTSKKQKSSENERRIRALEESLKQFSSGALPSHGNHTSSESDSDSSSDSDSDDSGSSSE